MTLLQRILFFVELFMGLGLGGRWVGENKSEKYRRMAFGNNVDLYIGC